MATKKCINGHQYDSSIYGDNCPFCPSSHSTRVLDDDTTTGKTQVLGGNMNAETDTIDLGKSGQNNPEVLLLFVTLILRVEQEWLLTIVVW